MSQWQWLQSISSFSRASLVPIFVWRLCVSLENIVHTKDDLWMPPILLIFGVPEECQAPYRAKGQQSRVLLCAVFHHLGVWNPLVLRNSQAHYQLLTGIFPLQIPGTLWGLNACFSFLPLINQPCSLQIDFGGSEASVEVGGQWGHRQGSILLTTMLYTEY